MLLTSHRPDFLVISPPKTGTTWLAANLRCHPQIFVPDIKEVKYFSSLLKWLDLEWYQSHFLAGSDRILGLALAAEPKQSTEFITSFVETNGSVWKW